MTHEHISKPIEITCEATEALPLNELKEFQGELKTRTDADYEKIFASIRKHGIAFPFFVWNKGSDNFILDGHGRFEALRRAAHTGYIIPELPIVYIEATDETTAKNLLLRLNSRFGIITIDGVRDFIDGADIDLEGINLPELPDLSSRLDALMNNMSAPSFDGSAYEPPEFALYCPECGLLYEATEDELRRVADYED